MINFQPLHRRVLLIRPSQTEEQKAADNEKSLSSTDKLLVVVVAKKSIGDAAKARLIK